MGEEPVSITCRYVHAHPQTNKEKLNLIAKSHV